MKPQSAHNKGRRLEQWTADQFEKAGLGKTIQNSRLRQRAN